MIQRDGKRGREAKIQAQLSLAHREAITKEGNCHLDLHTFMTASQYFYYPSSQIILFLSYKAESLPYLNVYKQFLEYSKNIIIPL